jgi:RHS repeat-associated protein
MTAPVNPNEFVGHGVEGTPKPRPFENREGSATRNGKVRKSKTSSSARTYRSSIIPSRGHVNKKERKGAPPALYYNNRLQPCRTAVNSSGTAPGSCSDAANYGNVLDYAYNFSFGTADNGNVIGITNNLTKYTPTDRSQQFTYDVLNRIATAGTVSTTGTNCWGEQYSYDNWGNLLSIAGITPQYTGCSQESGFTNTMTANNQIAGFCYDAAGNLLAQSPSPCTSPTYTYNAENQLTSTAGVTYTYDGEGKRVEKSNGKLYWYDTSGNVLDETGTTGSFTYEYIFLGGKRIARRDSSGNVDYYFADHLGTARVVTNATGTVPPLDDSDFYPFGGQRAVLSSSGNTYKFTGKERDSESGLDHFQFRNYSSQYGRWMIPDPAGMMAVDLQNPQTLNRYAYVRNNPLSFTDPLGLDCAYLNNSGTDIENRDQQSTSTECGKTGGYWVQGTLTDIKINADQGKVDLTGTNNGQDTTSASYQDTSANVGEYNNTTLNPFDHIALGFPGETPFGQNPRSDSQFLSGVLKHGLGVSVPGAIKPQVGGQLKKMVQIPVTGMQAQMMKGAINQSMQNPPPYAITGQTGCDCGTWAQQILGDAGINSGPPAPLPGTLMQQLDQRYPQDPQ